MVEFKHILFPCDLTENSNKILPFVMSMAEKYDSAIDLLHVVENLNRWGKIYVPHPYLNKLQEEALAAAEKALEWICDQKLKSCPNFRRRIVTGDPANQIIKVIEAENIDLVIMATHGRKGLEHTIFGSVAQNVVQRSPVPVLTINPYKLK